MNRTTLILFCLYLPVGAALAESATVTNAQGLNATQLFQQSSDALNNGDLLTAGADFFIAQVRAEADFHCFPAADEAQLNSTRDANTVVADRIYEQLEKDPKILSLVVSTVDSWSPTVQEGYDPGWTTQSRCSDYTKPASEAKDFTMQPIRNLSRLLNIPEYFQAYSVYNDVYRAYRTPPPDDAYSPERIKAADEAKKTIIAVEKSSGITMIGMALAYDFTTPLQFRKLDSGSTLGKRVRALF